MVWGRTCCRPATVDRNKLQRDKLSHDWGMDTGLPATEDILFCLLQSSHASEGIVSSFFTSPAPSEGSHE